MDFVRNKAAGISKLGRWATVGVVSLGVTSILVAAKEKPEAGGSGSIKSIMGKGFKGDSALVKKVSAGNGSADDVKQMLELCNALAAAKPKKGDLEDWKTRTAALVAATESIQKGDKSGAAALKTAADCKGCHAEHKGGK
jgi:hypothetical protein